MKKKIFLGIISLSLLTGCGATKTMTCSYKNTNTSNNITTEMKYDIDYNKKNEEIKKVRITYNYMQENKIDTDNDGKKDIDGVNTGTDGTTNDTQIDKDGIIDGMLGNAIDKVIGGVTDTILDVAGLKDRHVAVQNQYRNINGLSIQNTTDTDNNYRVSYVIDYDYISDSDLQTLNLSRDLSVLRNKFSSLGYTCNK